MDMETKRDMETMAEWASTMDAYDRLLERRARRRRWLRFIFNWRQIVDDPPAAVLTPDSVPSADTHHRVSASGVGTRAAGFRDAAPTNALTPLASGSRLPGGPHPYIRSEASRISAALNRHT